MKRALAAGLAVLLLAGCRRKDEPRAHPPAPVGGAAAPVDAGDVLVEDARAYEVKTWRVALERYDVSIEDVGMTTAIGEALERSGGELAVNGGFFGVDGKPLGLAISGGVRLSPLAKKLSGGVLTIAGDRARLFETESFEQPEGTRFAVQCRPRLVVGGRPNVKSDDGKRSERTALCIRDGGRTLEIALVRGEEGGPSLHALGRWLADHGCEEALNLDGGPSSGAAFREPDRGVLAPRGPIRHAIVFKKKT